MMTHTQYALRYKEVLLLGNSYKVLSRLPLILYAVWFSCVTVTKPLSSCNLQQLHLSTSKEVSEQCSYTENLVLLRKSE